mmetsp:Transcript_11763/g.18065  ORF Transcript_11763/g.18065 Transcript_11763/m.18065 type:complete len:380 (+) Transcript_11763:791-1930(+)
MRNNNPYTCKPNQNSCPRLPGKDPINNYMSYSSCKEKHFTEGQKMKMYHNFVQFRERTQPCNKDDEVPIDIEVKFKSNDSENDFDFTYRTWGKSFPLQIALISPEVDYSGQQISHTNCIPRNTMFEYQLNDPGSSLSYSIHGTTLYHESKIASKSSVLIFSGGECSEENKKGSRFQFEFQFDERPYEKEWKLTNLSTGKVIASQASTGAFGATHYYINWKSSRFFYDQCLPPDDYEFYIADVYDEGIDAPGYYKLFLDNTVIHQSISSTDPKPFKSSEKKRFTVPDKKHTAKQVDDDDIIVSASSSVSTNNNDLKLKEERQPGDAIGTIELATETTEATVTQDVDFFGSDDEAANQFVELTSEEKLAINKPYKKEGKKV